ncbi:MULTISPECIES: phage portal protein [unclassified Bradyrhizobium]|uniref:phage portal protein n=1 Tax=unclassified Bradyrhizobium TaxID=2631580 RepID=UPI001BAB8643|nr:MULTISPECIES: phage portal protein [unclassified Bradyrhizobium]WLA52364.1 phage portal protein [Bradyrhizobium elkanii]MBR1206970.1 phage portal protein [Bradyrhizobium sp. AUGA SZCCT0124]MBR1313509.1 phage portal protein [Bradyrhizobium sp. AUGA SZCCT0051]MBR1343394.1 phage portal protein [Bradyrhizobium sp. AUGA SZCCT0105]MBR1357186.1 phage portal protein [Bradyrhizobium sp. AUGA SZCCT0045]
MSWLDSILGASAPAVVVPENFEPPKNLGQTPLTEFRHGSPAWQEFFGPTNGLPPLTEYAARSVTSITACVNLISGVTATLPASIMGVDIPTGERSPLMTDELRWVLNEEMSPLWPASVGWEFLVGSMLYEGDAIAIIKRDRANNYRPIGLEPVHPLRVQNTIVPATKRMVYRISPQYLPDGSVVGETEIYDQDDIVHVPGFGFNGLRGMSPLRYSLRNAGGIALAAQEFAGRFFVNGARPDYALSTDQALADKKIQEIQDRIDERHRSVENAHRPMLLHSGLKMTTLQVSQADMQLLSQRQFQVEEIARAYGVPPFMIGHNEKTTSWGSGVEAMSIGFVRYTLRPHLNRFQVELNRKLFRTASRIVEFDTSDLEQADTKTLYESLRSAVGRAGEPRIMTPDEARARLRLKAMKGDAGKLGVNAGAAAPAKPADQTSNEDPAK